MKKYYGPIVLGLAALTVGAVATQTTVHADEATNGEQQPAETTDLTKAPLVIKTDSKIVPSVTIFIDISKSEPNDEFDIELEPDASFSDQKVINGQKINAHVSSDGKSITTDYILKFEQSNTDNPDPDNPNTSEVKITAPTNGIVAATGEKVTLDPKDFNTYQDEKKTTYFYSGDNYNFYNNKDKSKTDRIEVTVDKDGNVIVPADYLDKDGNVTLVDNLSVQSLKDDIKAKISYSKEYKSNDNQKGLDTLNANMAKDLNAIKFPADDVTPTSAQLREIKKNINSVMDKYTKNINLGHNSAQADVPILNDSNIILPKSNGENITISFDKTGKIKAAEVTDEKGNSIKSNTALQVSYFGDEQAIPVVNHNQKLPNNNNNGGTVTTPSKPSTTPDTTPSHTRSTSDYEMTFYSKPGAYTPLYDINGNHIKNRALSGNSSWYADKLMTLDSVQYVRVASGEWARLADGLEITPLSKVITTKNESALYTANGVSVKTRALSKNSSWVTDKAATINGVTMYRVATNEWVSVSDIK